MRFAGHSLIVSIVWFLGLVSTSLADDVSRPAQSTVIPFTGCKPSSFVLRSDFNDLGPLTCPTDYASAQGSAFSVTNNVLTRQFSTSLDGLAAYVWRFGYKDPNPNDDQTLIGFSLGPYLQGDGTYQLQPTPSQSRTSDTLTAGAFAQLSLYNPFLRSTGGIDNFRFRAGEVTANTGTLSTAFVGEWIPAYRLGPLNFGIQGGIPRTGIIYTFSPEVMVQYDQLDGGPNKYLLFSSSYQALRIGPELVVQFAFDPQTLPSFIPSDVRSVLATTSALATYHSSSDVYSGREYSWTQASITYSFGNDGHFGISGSYGYGNSETTGNLTSQFKLGFSAKL
jgi:hypothetical protein